MKLNNIFPLVSIRSRVYIIFLAHSKVVEMVGLSKILLVTNLILICLGSQVKSDASDHRYSVGDAIPFYANKVGPYSNPWETYAYYDLPFCSPDNVKEKKLNLGEMLSGDRLVSTPYKLEFRVDKDVQLLCKKRLNRTDVSRFRSVIEKDYYMEMYYDDLPVWTFIGMVDYTNESIKRKYFLFKQLYFEILYNEDCVISVNLTLDQKFLAELTEDEEEIDVDFTYTMKWSETRDSFDKRMERYVGSSISPLHMVVHRRSITNSCVTILVLVVCLLIFYVQVISKDNSRHARDVEEVELADNQEETGWKNIHGDVFRFPRHKSLLAAALGSGSQLLILMVAIIISGLIGVFQPFVRGSSLNSLVIIYVLTSVVSGYTSASFYYQLEGTNWMKNLLLNGGLYLAPLFLTFAFLNTTAVIYKVSIEMPLAAIVMLSLLWMFLASPLLLLGAIIGKNGKSGFQAPCQTNKCPREVPWLQWYRGLLPQMALAGILPFSVIYTQIYYTFTSVWGFRTYTLYGILAVAFFLLLIVTALVSVALTYFQLAAEDHQRWWRSFLCGGSTGLFIYGYCIYYYFWESSMNGFMQTSFFFGYMACVCYGVFLALGTVGFHSSFVFVRFLYGSIKCE